MENRILLVKAILLLYRESLLPDKSENSADLVRTVLEHTKSEINIVNVRPQKMIDRLKDFIIEMCNNPLDHEYHLSDLLQHLSLVSEDDPKFYEAVTQGLKEELSEAGLKRSVMSLRRSISNHFKFQTLGQVLYSNSQLVHFNKEKIKDINQYIGELISQLEPLQQSTSSKDHAVISEIDIGDDRGMGEILQECVDMSNGDKVYKTGWQGLNRALQGGPRPGDAVVVGAIQHSYKTGMTLSLFAQFALFNRPEPFLNDKNKKPLLLRISFEDKVVNNILFLYQYLKFNETRQRINIKNIDIIEAKEYIKEQLQQNGWHVKMIHVDPDQWTYRNIFNKVVEYEAEGYEVKVLMLDYLYKINKSGCTSNGMIGGEMADLLSKLRNFASSRDMLFVTPHQLSTEAKNLLRSGIPEDQFLAEIKGKGYLEGNKGLDRVYDIGIFIHLFKARGESFLGFCIDKHRISTVVEEEHKHFMYKFPKFMPLPHDEDGDDQSFKRLKDAFVNTEQHEFDTV